MVKRDFRAFASITESDFGSLIDDLEMEHDQFVEKARVNRASARQHKAFIRDRKVERRVG